MASEGSPSEAEEQKTVKLGLGDWRLAFFDPSVEGVAPITREGTEVPRQKEKEVRDQARRADVSVRKVS